MLNTEMGISCPYLDSAPYLARMMLDVSDMTTMEICVTNVAAPSSTVWRRMRESGTKLLAVKRKLLGLKK